MSAHKQTDEQGALVYQEIASQPQVWGQTLRRLQAERNGLGDLLFSQCWDSVFFTGAGSTHYLSLAAAALYQQVTGTRTRGLAASELALFPGAAYPDIARQQVLLVPVSRSGETTETIWAVDQQLARHLPVLAITCNGDSALAGRAQAVFVAQEAREEAVPQTRAFTSMYLVTQFLAGMASGDGGYMDSLQQLPSLAQAVLDRSLQATDPVTHSHWARVIFLGSGPYYGLACEGMLKLKEMALAWSEAYSFLEFRHGPISLVDDGTLVVGLLSDTAQDAERSVLAGVRELGAHTLTISETAAAAEGADYALALASGLPELARGALYVLPLQILAYEHARFRGLDPDRPRHLEQVVMLAPA